MAKPVRRKRFSFKVLAILGVFLLAVCIDSWMVMGLGMAYLLGYLAKG